MLYTSEQAASICQESKNRMKKSSEKITFFFNFQFFNFFEFLLFTIRLEEKKNCIQKKEGEKVAEQMRQRTSDSPVDRIKRRNAKSQIDAIENIMKKIIFFSMVYSKKLMEGKVLRKVGAMQYGSDICAKISCYRREPTLKYSIWMLNQMDLNALKKIVLKNTTNKGSCFFVKNRLRIVPLIRISVVFGSEHFWEVSQFHFSISIKIKKKSTRFRYIFGISPAFPCPEGPQDAMVKDKNNVRNFLIPQFSNKKTNWFNRYRKNLFKQKKYLQTPNNKKKMIIEYPNAQNKLKTAHSCPLWQSDTPSKFVSKLFFYFAIFFFILLKKDEFKYFTIIEKYIFFVDY